MAGLWLIQLRTGNAGIVDAGWSGGLGLVAVFFAATSDGEVFRRVAIAAMVGIWSLRLTTYILRDRVIGKPEEGRYVSLREQWGKAADRNLFFFFQMQAATVVLLALPFLVAAQNSLPSPSVWDYLAVAIWLVGVSGTAIADRQLERFKQRPDSSGKTCRKGLWRYSRHPNYFFEWVTWCSYIPLCFGSAYWWVGPMSPLLLLFFILKVTGIPPTERQALKSRGEDYRRYQRTTSPFVPWPPKGDPA